MKKHLKIFMKSPEVFIVGAGPTGLMMALNLQRYRVPFRIVDKKAGITVHSKAGGMHARSLEIFRDLGLDEELLRHGNPLKTLEFFEGKERLGCFDFSHLETAYPFILGIPQSETERILIKALESHGRHVEWNTEVTALHEEKESVHVTCSSQGKKSHGEYVWVIGCDGLHGIVKQEAKIPFVGVEEEAKFAIADIHSEGMAKDKASIVISKDSAGVVAFFPLGEGFVRVVIDHVNPNVNTPLSLEEIKAVIQKRTGSAFPVSDMEWSSLFHIYYKEAQCFSKGRYFLAGDAAHVHSPVGGQGMNTGLQDAYNLAWKMAAVYHGKSPEKLLHTYNEERWTNARRVLRITHMMTKVGLAQYRFLKTWRPRILKYLFRHSHIHEAMILKISQLEVNYRGMSLSQEDIAFFNFGRGFGKAPHAGERVVDEKITVVHKPHLHTFCDYLRGGEWHLIVFLAQAIDHKHIEQLKKLEKIYSQQVKKACVVHRQEEIPQEISSYAILLDSSGKLHRRYGALKPSLYLIRPDQYIGMRTFSLNAEPLKKYFKKIFL